jgi:hypothetical protein
MTRSAQASVANQTRTCAARCIIRIRYIMEYSLSLTKNAFMAVVKAQGKQIDGRCGHVCCRGRVRPCGWLGIASGRRAGLPRRRRKLRRKLIRGGMALRYRATAALAKGVTMGYSGCGLSERLSGTRPTERCPARSRWVRSASRRLQLIRRRLGFCGLTGLVTPICAQPGFVPEMTWWGICPCYWPPWVCSERVLAGLTLSWPRSWPGWRCRARQL